MTIGPYPISRMPHIERLEADEAHLVKNLNVFTPGDPEYAYYLDCLEENARRLRVRDLMLEADKREQVCILDAPVAEHTAYHIQFEMEIIGEVDETLQEHYLDGPEYNPHMTPTEEYIRQTVLMSSHWCRGPEPMLDRG